MAQTKRSAKVDTRNARLKLQAGKDHVATLGSGSYLHYKRTTGAGTWRARWRNKETGKILSFSIGIADDMADDNGEEIHSYERAVEKAQALFKDCAKSAERAALGEVEPETKKGAYTVNVS